MKYIFWFFAGVFVLFAFFQYNDPDALRWIFIYLLAAGLMAVGALNRVKPWMIYTGYVVFGSGFLFLFPSFIEWLTVEKGQNLMQRMQDSKMYIEETREFLGLGICLACTSLLWIPLKFTSKK